MVRARKRFGQHFLERAWIDKLIQAIHPQASETFLEVGPGRGALTAPLSARVRHLVAFEIDRDLAADLRAAGIPNMTLVEGDFLRVPAARIETAIAEAGGDPACRVAGNLPYNVAAPMLFRLLELRAEGLPILDATVMVQREVADRLIASPGTREYGVLAILLGYSARIERLLALPPGAFRPVPKVHSAVVRLRFRLPDPAAANPALFRGLVKAIFEQRRKTMTNALKGFGESVRLPPAAALAKAEIDGRRRPETLSMAELVRLADIYAVDHNEVVADPGAVL